jgi:Domain of unknown function (DUF4337)
MSETHEHLEQAEHAGHGADPFTVRVAMTMAIIAAILAAVSLIGHRKHNEALQKQGDSNRLLTESAGFRVESSNIFAWYQSKRARVDDADKSITNTKLYAAAPNSDSLRDEVVAKWEDYKKKNNTKPKDIKVDDKGFPLKSADGQDDDSLGALIVRGNHFKEMAEEKKHEAEKADHEYHHVHKQADELDWAHLAVELGLVLCTICILTKKWEYWMAGILAALVGAGLATFSLFAGQ